MRVLITSLVDYPPLLEILGKKVDNPFCGWCYAASESLMNVSDDLCLGVISMTPAISKVERYESNRYVFYRIPSKGLQNINDKEISFAKEIIDDFKPDIIHLYGTEYSLGLEIISANSCRAPVVASIQGLAFVYYRYNQGYISSREFLKHYSFRDFVKNENQFRRNRIMYKRGLLEEKTLKSIRHVIGRTGWDRIHSTTVNPELTYHFCNETLRDVFYSAPKWNYDKCRRFSVFCSNGSMPLKGVHFLLQALHLVKRSCPDVLLRVAGPDVLSSKWSVRMKLTSYQNYLKSLIKHLGLEHNVEFLGFLSQNEMVAEYQRCNVYVLPSCIENSPNSLCEAQMLGVPCISSICGGTPDFVNDGIDGFLYRCEEWEMLADKIMYVFANPDMAVEMGQKAVPQAMSRHDATNNAKTLIQIYNDILSNG